MSRSKSNYNVFLENQKQISFVEQKYNTKYPPFDLGTLTFLPIGEGVTNESEVVSFEYYLSDKQLNNEWESFNQIEI